jgi:hypothetical protein
VSSKRELLFWQRRADQNSLIISIRAYRERAISFFGAIAVLTENEAKLFRTLEAHTIIATPSNDLLKKMNQIPKKLISEEGRFSQSERKELRKQCYRKLKDIVAMKREAQRHVRFVTGT